MDAAEHVHQVLRQYFGVDAQGVPGGTELHELKLDSLALEEFRVIIEERMLIDLEDVQITSRDTLARLVGVVGAKAVS